jgi:hypothetical protein
MSLADITLSVAHMIEAELRRYPLFNSATMEMLSATVNTSTFNMFSDDVCVSLHFSSDNSFPCRRGWRLRIVLCKKTRTVLVVRRRSRMFKRLDFQKDVNILMNVLT